MKLTLCLDKTTVIFYSIIMLPIIFGSLHNLIYGVIRDENSVVYVGAFSLFGFIILPLAILATYRKNKCVIDLEKVTIGKVDYPLSDYSFYIHEKELALKDRPLFSLLRKTYYVLVFKEKRTGKVVFENDLNVFQSDIKRIKAALPQN